MKNIVKDIDFLSQPSDLIKDLEESKDIIKDLKEVALANFDKCAGLAAVQIGYHKSIILVRIKNSFMVMINPKITMKYGKSYTTTEGCLSLEGMRKTQRYADILVSYKDINFNQQIKKYNGRVAQIIQHEVDHTLGVLI